MNITKQRREELLRAMRAKKIAASVFCPSSDFLYLTANGRQAAQRMVALLVSADRCAVLLPDFEQTSNPEMDPELERIPYTDSDDAVQMLCRLLPAEGCIAVGSAMRADLLLSLQQNAPHLTWCCADEILSPIRRRKTAQEVQIIETAQHMAERALSRLLEEKLVGHTEREIAARLAELRLQEGFDRVGAGIIASGPNTANPHHANSDRILCEGDVLMFDIGGTYRGYHADFTRTYVVGRLPDGFAEIYQIVLEAHLAGKAAARAGAPACEVDRAARLVIEKAGYGPFFSHRLGHGIGLDIHEPPFLVDRNSLCLENGNVFSCEPGIYLPGRFGVRIEDLLVLENGCARSLNTLSKELRILPV